MLTVEKIMAMKDPHKELCETGKLHKSSEVLAQLTEEQQHEVASRIVISLSNMELTHLLYKVNGFNPLQKPAFADTLAQAATIAKKVQALTNPSFKNPQDILKNLNVSGLFQSLLDKLLVKHRASILENISNKEEREEVLKAHPALSRAPSLVNVLPAPSDQKVIEDLLSNARARLQLQPGQRDDIESFLNEDEEPGISSLNLG